MAQKVRVWNDNVVEHREMYKGSEIRIPAGGYVEMDREEAVQFKSQFRTPVRDKAKIQTVESKKILRLEMVINGAEKAATPKAEKEKHICHKCGFEAQNKAGLSAHIRANHLESMVDEDARKELEKG
jgi:hypothetical protein